MWHRDLDRKASSVRHDRDRRRWCTRDACPGTQAGGPSCVGPFLEGDLFSWKADRRYDAVFFGFWISHVPEDKFTLFWTMVAEALMPGGHVFFFAGPSTEDPLAGRATYSQAAALTRDFT